MRRKLQLVGLSAMALWRAASDPRCKVKGYFQSTPFIFSCDGSGGDRDTNIAEVYMESRGSQEIVRIPQGTLDFVVSLDSDAEADLIVLDGSDNVVPHMMHSVGNNQWLGNYKGMDISYSASTGSPTSEKLSFSGSPTPELSLRLVSHATTPSNFRIGYYYFPYADGQGPQCRQGGAPVGCKHYHEASVREAVVGWANWLLSRYADAETAWAKLMIPLAVDSVVPYHHWCSAWNAWPAASSSSVECMEAYKFVTSGGLEAHSTKIFKEQFLWAFSLPAIANFDAQCCGKLRASFKQGSLAWDHIKKVQGQYNLESPLQGLMKVCESVSLAPKSRDYALFLDADGDRPVGNIAAEDISHCWNEDATPLMPTPKPAVASATPMSMPMPTSTPTPTHKPAASPTTTKQVPYSPTPTPTAMTAATPTPTPTPMVPQQSLGQTPTPTPTPTPLPSDLNQYLLPSTSTRPSLYTPFTSTRSSSPRPVSTSSPRPVSTSSSHHHHHQHLVSTTLIAPAHKGATELLVGSHAGFQIGQQIDIDLGKPNHEVATIKSLGRIDLGSGRRLGPHYLGRIDLGSGLHRQHEAGAMITGKAHQTSTPAPHSTARPRAPTPRPIWRVPTVFHYQHIHEHSCSGHSFTNGPEPSCVGWMQVTPQFCQEKCANSQTSPGCPRRPCMAAVFFADGGWCHLYTADQCRHLKSVQGATTYKKESGGGHAKGLPHSGTHGAGHSSASAKPPIGQEAQGLKQKHIPFLVAGIAGGAAAGAALMAGAGIVISSISASKKGQPPAAPQGVSLSNTAGNPLHKPPSVASPSFSARTVNATAATGVPTLPPIANASTTSIPLTMWDQASASLHSGGSLQGGISAGPVLPLACLAVVCLCGLTALIVAAVIDPCQRGGRKRVHRGGDVGGSVASVGSLGDSVASVGSMDSEQAAYYDGYEGYSDQYGNSIASVATYEGGSVYTYEGGSVGEAPGQYEYDYLPQDAHRPLYNEYGYPSTTPLPQNHQVPDYGAHPASHAGSYGAQRMVYAS